MTIYFVHLPPNSSHLHPLEGENCDGNSRPLVDEDDNGKFRLEMVNFMHIMSESDILHHIQNLAVCYTQDVSLCSVPGCINLKEQ